MAIKLIKHGLQEEKKKEQSAGPDQMRLTAQSWVNEFKERKRNARVSFPGERESLEPSPLKRAA